MIDSYEYLVVALMCLPGFAWRAAVRSLVMCRRQSQTEMVMETLGRSLALVVAYLLLAFLVNAAADTDCLTLEGIVATARGARTPSQAQEPSPSPFLNNKSLVLFMVVLATAIVIEAYLRKHDLFHHLFRRIGASRRESRIDVWDGTFSEAGPAWVSVRLPSGETARGYVRRYSDTAEEPELLLGHVLVADPSGTSTRSCDAMYIRGQDAVRTIEFVKWKELLVFQQRRSGGHHVP